MTAPKQAADRADEIARRIVREFVYEHFEIGEQSPREMEPRLFAAIASAIRSAEPQWQPIETAPKNGTLFLVATIYDLSSVHEAYWDRDFGGLCFYDRVQCNNATHWMPLPAPPALPEAISGKEG
jgi:hypothetical protein